MQLIKLVGLLLAAKVQAQLVTTTICESYSFTSTLTFTEYTTYYTTADAIGGSRSTSRASAVTSLTSFTLPPASSSSGVTDDGIGGSWSRTTTSTLRSTSFTSQVPGNGTSVLIPDNTITPSTPIPTSFLTITSSSSSRATSSLTSTTTTSAVDTSSSSSMSRTTLTTSTTSSVLTSTSTSTSPTSVSSAMTSDSTTTTTVSTTTPELKTSSESASSSMTSTTTTSSSQSIVTNQAYIDTVLRHHNRHRTNHTAPDLVWNAALAATAKKIADSCIYAHDTATDCPSAPNEACYGQNIGAGYLPVQMGSLISEGFYNSEVNHYTYYGAEPDYLTLHEWGHFSQIVWVGTGSVGCYTSDCTVSGLQKIDPLSGIRPFFTVCNYGPPGNYVDEFANNVLAPIPLESIYAGYQCPTDENCENGSV